MQSIYKQLFDQMESKYGYKATRFIIYDKDDDYMSTDEYIFEHVYYYLYGIGELPR